MDFIVFVVIIGLLLSIEILAQQRAKVNLLEFVKVAAMPIAVAVAVGEIVHFRSHAGRELAARVVGYDPNRGYALRRRGHPAGPVFYRSL